MSENHFSDIEEKTQTSVSNADIRIKLINNFSDLEKYRNDWDRLSSLLPQKNPKTSFSWVVSHIRSYSKSVQKWFCLFFLDQNSVLGIFPLVQIPFKSSYKLKTPLSTSDFIMKSGLERKLIHKLLSFLRSNYPDCHRVELNRIPENSPIIEITKNHKFPGYHIIHEHDGFGSFINLRDSFQNYYQSLSKNFKKLLKKREKQLNNLKNLKISIPAEGPQIESLHKYLLIEENSWKHELGTTIPQSPNAVKFYQDLTQELQKLGWIEFHFLETDLDIIAGHIAVRLNRKLILLKTSYNDNYSKLSPGLILFKKMLETAYNRQDIDEIDLLTDLNWHDRWQVSKRKYYNLRLYPYRLYPLLTGFLPDKLKYLAKTTPGLRNIYGTARSFYRRMKSNGS